MSEFEREIQQRIPDFLRRQAEERRQQELEAERSRAKARQESHEKDQKETQVRQLGREVVRLLQKYKIPSEPVWALEVTGKHTRDSWGKYGIHTITEDRRDYVSQGRGWRIYASHSYVDPSLDSSYVGSGHFSSRIGLIEDGRVFEISPFKARRDMYHGSSSNVHEGLAVSGYIEGDRATAILNSDYFKDAVASLINGSGPLGWESQRDDPRTPSGQF